MYHLLFELGEWLDGRVWPRTDQLQVLRLLDLVHHVTGKSPPALPRSSSGLLWPCRLSVVPASGCVHVAGLIICSWVQGSACEPGSRPRATRRMPGGATKSCGPSRAQASHCTSCAGGSFGAPLLLLLVPGWQGGFLPKQRTTASWLAPGVGVEAGLRRCACRLAAWTHPSNPGLTAAEALTAPFFTGVSQLPFVSLPSRADAKLTGRMQGTRACARSSQVPPAGTAPGRRRQSPPSGQANCGPNRQSTEDCCLWLARLCLCWLTNVQHLTSPRGPSHPHVFFVFLYGGGL